MNPKRIHVGLVIALAIGLAAIPPCRAVSAADEELSIEEETAPPAAVAATPAPKPAAAKPAPAKAPVRQGSVLLRINVIPTTNKVEVRMEGKGNLVPEILKLVDENKLVLDFKGASYKAPGIVLGAPGIGDVLKVRGGQFQVGVARVVIELKKMVSYTTSSKPGVYILVLETQGVVGPEEMASLPVAPGPVEASPVSTPAGKVPAPVESTRQATGDSGVRSRLLHAMVSDLDDRVRLVATSDGVVKYKIASQDGGKELVLTLYDMDLKWVPARIDMKDGPVISVRAEEVSKPARHVRMAIRLRQALPYHVKRDQNQVVIEVERAGDATAGSAVASTRGDLMHRVTLNVQGEDLASLIKGLAFEAGFENVVVSQKSVSGVQPVTISLRDVPLAKALNLILAPESLVWKVERNVLKVAKADVFDIELETSAVSGGSGGDSDAGGDDEGGIVTRVFRLRYVNVLDKDSNASVVDTITSLLQNKKRGKVIVDGRVNALIITDNDGNLKLLEKVIRQLDISVPQVMIEARLIKVDANKTQNIGIDWKAENTRPVNPTLDSIFTDPYKSNAILTTGLLGPGFNINAALSALIVSGNAQDIMNPRIATVDNRKATITSENSLPYNDNAMFSPNVGSPYPITTQKQIPVPVTLEVTPHVNPNKTVILDVSIMASTPGKYTPGDIPPIVKQTAVTQLIVRDGETAVIGGMLTDSINKDQTKVPLLGDLPWFLGGALFRSESTKIVKSELVLFLTPRIMAEF